MNTASPSMLVVRSQIFTMVNPGTLIVLITYTFSAFLFLPRGQSWGSHAFSPVQKCQFPPQQKIVHCQYWVLAYSKSTKHQNKAQTSFKKTHPQEANHHGIYSQPRERRSQWQGTPTKQQTQLLPPFQYPPASTLSTQELVLPSQRHNQNTYLDQRALQQRSTGEGG